MSELVLLRTLTKRSPILFGRYSDLTVQELLNVNKYRYLRWMYFCCSKINFIPDILEQLGITSDYIINKPGVNENLMDKLNNEKSDKMGSFTKLKQDSHKKKVNKFKTRRAYGLASNIEPKGVMQARNQRKY